MSQNLMLLLRLALLTAVTKLKGVRGADVADALDVHLGKCKNEEIYKD